MKRSILLSVLFSYVSLFAGQPTLSYTTERGEYEGNECYYIDCTLVGRATETNNVIFTAYTNDIPVKVDNLISLTYAGFPASKQNISDGTSRYVWYFKKDNPGINVESDNLVINAELDTITIQFISDDGEVNPTQKTYAINSLMDELPEVTLDKCCEFTGWYNRRIGGDKITTNTIASVSYTELYAGLNIKVVFEPRISGISCFTNTYQVNNYYTNLSNVTAEGYMFIGWYTDPINGQLVKNGSIVLATTDRLYAHYTEYLVIDISAGPNATSYPTSLLYDIPQIISEDGTITNKEWTSEYKTNKIVLKKIEGGKYNLKSTYYQPEPTSKYPRPIVIYPVTISDSFYLGIFQITQKQWQLVMGNKPSHFNNSKYYSDRPVESLSWSDIRQCGDLDCGKWPNDEPANNSFLGKLSSKVVSPYSQVTLKFDLPTENEWEYSCRADTETDFNNGMDSQGEPQDINMNILGRYYYNSKIAYQKCSPLYGTAIVGSYQPNNWDLYDMHGNVFEWCLDYYQLEFISDKLVDPTGPDTGTDRVIRGGSWKYMAYDCTSGVRYYLNPTNKTSSTGFRIKAKRSSN